VSATADHLYDALIMLRSASRLADEHEAQAHRDEALGSLEQLVEALRKGEPYPEVIPSGRDVSGFVVVRRPR